MHVWLADSISNDTYRIFACSVVLTWKKVMAKQKTNARAIQLILLSDSWGKATHQHRHSVQQTQRCIWYYRHDKHMDTMPAMHRRISFNHYHTND